MKFGYMELQKPTRDECSWIIGMTEAGININRGARHLVFIKQLLTEESIVSGEQCWLETARNRTDRKKLTSLEERFIHSASRRERFLPALCWSLRNVSGMYAWFRQNGLEQSLLKVEDGQNIDILSSSKHFYDRDLVPFNEMKFLLQRCIQDLVLNKIVMVFTANNLIKFVIISTDCFQ